MEGIGLTLPLRHKQSRLCSAYFFSRSKTDCPEAMVGVVKELKSDKFIPAVPNCILNLCIRANFGHFHEIPIGKIRDG